MKAGESLQFNTKTTGNAEKDMNSAITRVVLAMSAVLRNSKSPEVIKEFVIKIKFPPCMLRHLYYQIKDMQAADGVPLAEHLQFEFIDSVKGEAISAATLAEWDSKRDKPLYDDAKLEELKTSDPEKHKAAEEANSRDKGCGEAMKALKDAPVVAGFKQDIEEAQGKLTGELAEETPTPSGAARLGGGGVV